MKYYIKFSKQGYIKYTSHLDMLNIFERAFKRADLPLQYSQGYHPHPKIVFAQALSLGFSSLCEIMDFELKEEFEDDRLVTSLQAMLPEGIDILSIGRSDGHKSFAARLDSTVYRIEFPEYLNPAKQDLVDFFKQESIIVEKKRKKRKQKRKKTPSVMKVDIRPLILVWEYLQAGPDFDFSCLRVRLSSNRQGSLNPNLLMKALTSYLCEEYRQEDYEIERERMFFTDR